MDLLQAIISNNKLVAESLESGEPALRRLCGKVAEKVRRGGRIFCLGGDSHVPTAYPSPQGFFTPVAVPVVDNKGDAAWLALQQAGAGTADVVVAIDDECCAAILAEGMRSCRRKGLLTACISCNSASTVAQAAEFVVYLPLEVVLEERGLKESAARQMALAALLTTVLGQLGYIADAEDGGAADSQHSESALRAAETLMMQCPGMERETAIELIVKFGSVRKAAQSYKANV